MSKKYTTNFLEDTNGSTGSANQVLVSTAAGVDWVDGSGSGIIGGPYLPLAGGTLTGGLIGTTATFSGNGIFTAKIGIGTTSPQAFTRLDIRSESGTANSHGIASYGYNETSTAILGQGYHSGTGVGTNYGVRGISNGPRSGTVGSVNVGGYFEATSAEKNYALITGNGNVGIGTTSPGAKLEVNGQIVINSTELDGNDAFSIYNNTNELLNVQNSSTGDEASLFLGAGNVRKIKLDTAGSSYFNGGNVGIGTTSPGQKLDVDGSVNIDGTLFVNTNNNHIRLIDTDNTGNFSVGVNSNFQIRDITANTTPLTIRAGTPNDTILTTASGRVGISQNSPGTTLHVGGFTRIDGGLQMNTANAPIYQILDSDLRLGTNNTERMRITNTGQVGIGTTNPAVTLDVQGSIFTRGGLYFTPNGSTSSVPTWGMVLNAAGDLVIDDTTGPQNVIFSNSGNVGIGTTTPTAPLHIEGGTSSEVLKIEADANPYIRWVQNGTNVGFLQFNGGSAYLANMANGSFFFRTNNTDKMTILSSGNVGIGTTSPRSLLEIGGSGNLGSVTNKVISTIIDGGYSTLNSLQYNVNAFIGTTYGTSDIFAQTSGEVLKNFYTGLIAPNSYFNNARYSVVQGGAERLTVIQGGNVGIGTTSPGSDLEIFNTSGSTVISEARISSLVTSGYGGQSNLWLRTSNYGSAMIAFGNQNGASTVASSASGKITYNSYNGIFTVTADSNALLTLGGTTDRVGVNQTNPQYTLDVTGNGRFTSTVTATNFILSSDEKLKENVEKVCGNKVEAEWKTFELKTERGQKRYGVIAQELEKTNPEFVREDSQGFKSVAYIDLLIAKIAELEARLEKLEK